MVGLFVVCKYCFVFVVRSVLLVVWLLSFLLFILVAVRCCLVFVVAGRVLSPGLLSVVCYCLLFVAW